MMISKIYIKLVLKIMAF